MTQPTHRKVRIFIASPSDVATERNRLKNIVSQLDRELGDKLGFVLEPLDWRTHVAPLMGRPEQVILDQLAIETWDIFVGILWHRFGTPPDAIDAKTGKPFESGTEEEFTLAYHLWQQKGRPHILFYRCKRNPPLDQLDADQYKEVQRFFTGFNVTGPHPGLIREYKTVREFEKFVRQDLMTVLFSMSNTQHGNTPPISPSSAGATPSAVPAPVVAGASQPDARAAEREAVRDELDRKKRRYWELKKQAASFGISVEPHITMEIEDLEGRKDYKGNLIKEGEIAKLERRLNELGG